MGYGADILKKGLVPHAAYFELLNALCEKLLRVPALDHDEYWRRVLALNPGERAFLLTNEMTGEVGNGGFEQYFDNTGYERAHETIRAFKLIGAMKNAEFLRKATEVAKIPDPLPPGWEPPPCDYDIELAEAERTRAALNSLDTEYYKGQDDTCDLMVRYVQRHPDEFE
jgi:hypothetical protein